MGNRWLSVPIWVAVVVIAFTYSSIRPAHALSPIHKKPASRPSRARTADSGPGGYTPYHNGATLVCSDCHTMHASAKHDFAGGANPYVGDPNPKLLKASDSVYLCLACHDGRQGVPDVMGADANGLTERSAGFFESPGTTNMNGHDLGTGLSTEGSDLCMRCHFGGEFATAKVTCVDCHNPHGNDNARNLQWASYAGYEPPFGLLVDPSATGLDKYERQHVSYGTLDSDVLREVSNMCLDCHHVFSGATYTDSNGNGIHERHPTYDTERSSPNNIRQGEARGSTRPDHWLAGVGSGFTDTPRVPFVVDGASDFASATVVNPDTNGVFCLSCHKAHGSSHSFSLTFTGGISPRGCDQCHNTAGS